MASFRDSYKAPVLVPVTDPETGEPQFDAGGQPLLKQKLDSDGNPEFRSEPRLWTVNITYGVALELRSRHKLDLLSEKSDIEKVLKDPMAVLMVLDVALEKQLRERGMRIEDLPMVIDDLELAREMDEAVMEAVIDFFPKRHREPLLESRRKIRMAVAKRETLMAIRLKEKLSSPELMKNLERGLDQSFAKIEADLDRELAFNADQPTSGTSPGSSEEPSAS